MLAIKQLPLGPLGTNCYIVYQGGQALLIDPGSEADQIEHWLDELEVEALAILLTHSHYDHIGAVDAMRNRYDIPVYLSAAEKDWLGDPNKNLSALSDQAVKVQPADYLLSQEDGLTIGPFTFRVLATPGHSPGGLAYVFDDSDCFFSGDALFAGGVGRTDLPGSEPETLLTSIRTKLFTLPNHYTVYPGHGATTTIVDEIQNNPFFN